MERLSGIHRIGFLLDPIVALLFIQPLHLIVILAVALIVFGPGKLPELGKSLGEAIRGFKKAMNDEHAESPKLQETPKDEKKLVD